MLRQWPTEDGYLMLTIARNMALGNGMSTADGELPTNGTQPLATTIWSAVFAAVDADKETGVFIVLCIELMLSLLAAYLLFRIARNVFREIEVDPQWAWLVAGLWYASGNTIHHSMNTLESGLYVTLVMLFVLICQNNLARLSSLAGRLSWGTAGLMSFVLALCFYARNDAALLIAAFCSTYVLFGIGSIESLKDRFVKAFCIGAGTIVFSLPWLVYNVTQFGHIMPISGVAQSAASGFGDNAYQIPIGADRVPVDYRADTSGIRGPAGDHDYLEHCVGYRDRCARHATRKVAARASLLVGSGRWATSCY